MKKLIEYALNHPATFIVIPLLVLVFGIVTLTRIQTDIFPKIDSPAVSVVWTYSGISAEDMEKRIVTIAERNYTSTVSNIEHTESQSLYGVGIIKIFLQPGSDLSTAITQVNAASQTVLSKLPRGIMPPEVLKYTPSTIPVVRLILSSKSLSMEKITDIAQNHLKSSLATVYGAQVPMPVGGKTKQIILDLNPKALEEFNLTPMDIVNTISTQNVILPSGSVKIGRNDYYVLSNNSPANYLDINSFPVMTRNDAVTYIRDVGNIHEGYSIPTNIVKNNNTPASLISIFKTEDASTLKVKASLDDKLPDILKTIPKEIDVKQIFDQSLFVNNSIKDVVTSGILAILLTSVMVLLFLGNLETSGIIMLSIPLSVLLSIIALYLTGQSLNMMTLGGLSLAVGMLVDDSTVVVENIQRNFRPGLDIKEIILNSAAEVATPQFFSTISVCLVFFPVFLMKGISKSLFVPMAMAVVFAMLASYFFANTLIPCLSSFINYSKEKLPFHKKINSAFDKLKEKYQKALSFVLGNPKKPMAIYSGVILSTILLLPLWINIIGCDFFPYVDTGEIRMHVYAPAGTRLEETSKKFSDIENTIRTVIPKREITTVLSRIGLPNGGINLAFMDNSSIGVSDGEISVALDNKHERKTAKYIKRLRKVLNEKYPDTVFFFQKADMTGQILSFGLSSEIDVKVSGKDKINNYKLTKKMLADIKRISGVKDAHIHQNINVPALKFNVDRLKINAMGQSEDDVIRNILTSLDSSTQTTPSFWVDTVSGVNYTLAVRVPPYRFSNFYDITNLPVNNINGVSEKLVNTGILKRSVTANVINHYNIQPVYDIFINVENSNLYSVNKKVQKVAAKYQKAAPRGTFIEAAGTAKTMNETFTLAGYGLLLSFIIVYLIAVINFQSFKNAVLLLVSPPFAFAGALLALYLTDTTISTPAIMGMLMAIGVSCANSTLLGAFLIKTNCTKDEILEAAQTRLRPVIMTTTAMILGLLPMAFGIGEGGEQNAPLARTVIGGLLLATVSTLFIVPLVFSIINKEKVYE